MSVKSPKSKNERDIKKAVDKIPGLIFEQVEFKSPPPKEKKTPTKNYQTEKKKKTLVWFGVIILTIIILGMWSWNTFVNFDTLLKKDNPDSIMNQAKDSFEKTKLETKYLEPVYESPTTTEENTEEIKNKIKENLAIIINQMNSASSTTSTLTTTTEPSFPVAKTISTPEMTEKEN